MCYIVLVKPLRFKRNNIQKSQRVCHVAKKRSKFLSAVALTSALIFGIPSCATLDRTVMQSTKSGSISDLDWKRTHLVIINGDTEARHKGNVINAINTGLKNNAASIHLAGISSKEVKTVKKHKGDLAGIEEMFRGVNKNYREGDIIFIYVTGHGNKGVFVLEDHEETGHNTLLQTLEKNLKGKNIVFVSDACYSADFVNLLMESKKFGSVTAMSPGLKDETTSCTLFATPFWHAISHAMDLDGNGIATLEEAFSFALKRYQQLKSDTLGTYRKNIPEITSLDEVTDGVVMVTADWCKACQSMESVFNTIMLLSNKSINFHLIDVKNADFVIGAPTFFIIKDGKTVASEIGAKNFKEFHNWLLENGVDLNYSPPTVKEFYEKGKYASIIHAFSYAEIEKELGIVGAFELMIPMFNHPDPTVRNSLLLLFLGPSFSTKFDYVIPNSGMARRLEKLSKDENESVRENAAVVFTKGTQKHPEEMATYLKGFLEGKDGSVRRGVAYALAILVPKMDMSKNKDLVDVILNLFNDERGDVRSMAGIVLLEVAKKNSDEIVPRLKDLLNKKTNAREEIVLLFSDIAGTVDLSRYQGLVDDLAELLKDDNPRLKAASAFILKRYQKTIDPHIYDEAIGTLVEFLKYDIHGLQKTIATQMAELASENPDVIIPHIRRLIEHRDIITLQNGVLVLSLAAELNPGKVIPSVQKLMKDESARVRQAAILTLRTVGTRDVNLGEYSGIIEGLVELVKDKEDRVMAVAVKALTDITPKNPKVVLGHLIGSLMHSDGDRQTIVDIGIASKEIAKKYPDKIMPYIEAYLKHDDIRVKAATALMIALISGTVDIGRYKGIVGELEELSKNKNPEIRKIFEEVLKQLKVEQTNFDK